MRSTLFFCALASLCAFAAHAQDDTRQASITGRGGSPKCTIEVQIDQVADVEIRATVARLHTLAGTPAVWRRFECNRPMPTYPGNFRFRGIDGRGRQTVIGDPTRTGVAVVRLEDPKSGREGYTFDLEWQGSAGPMGGGPGSPGPLPDRDRDRDRQFAGDQAIHRCADQAQDQLRRTGYSDLRIVNAKIDGDQGRGDWIYGTLSGQRGRRVENFGFACSVDFQNRTVGAANVRPADSGYYGQDYNDRFSRERALRACREAVQERLGHDGYSDFAVGRIDVDDRPGNKDWIVGGLTARRDGYSDNFDFSCSVDFDAGRIRSINVNRRFR